MIQKEDAVPVNDTETLGEGVERTSTRFSLRKASKIEILTFISIGVVNFAGFGTYSIISPFFPNEVAVIGSRFMLITGIFVTGCASILFGFLDYMEGTTFVVFCIAIRTTEALGVSAYATASTTILTHAFPNDVAKVMGILEIFTGVGLMACPPIGGLLYKIGGFRLPFLSMGGLMLSCGVIVWILVPPQADEREEEKKSGALLKLLKVPTVILTCGIVVVIAAAMSYLDPILQPFLESQFSLSPTTIGLIFLLRSAVYTILAPLWGWLADKKGASRIMTSVGMVTFAVSCLLIGPSPLLTEYIHIFPNAKPLWITIVGLVVMAVAMGVEYSPVYNELLWAARDAGLEENIATFGVISGLFYSFFAIGEFVGPTVSSALVQQIGLPWASTAFGGLALFYTVVMVVFYVYDSCYRSKRGSIRQSTDEEKPLLG
ncbi:MFS-type transporter SLC18B1-like isoform X2 [Branchiostoma floridae x Branchiostoma japonicum]